jgi:hypothetical protein
MMSGAMRRIGEHWASPATWGMPMTQSLTPEQMEARTARFHKLQTYQKQNFEAHIIPHGAVE